MKVRKWVYSLAALALVGLVTLLAISALQLGSGDAPDFELALFDPQAGIISDSTLKLSDFQSRPVVLNFWAAWCPPCRAETPHLVETYEEYKDRGVQFIAWTSGPEEKGLRARPVSCETSTYPIPPGPTSRAIYSQAT